MNIAFLGFDSSLRCVYSALAADRRFNVQGIYGASDAAKEFCKEHDSIALFADDEDLFALTEVQLIVISNDWLRTQADAVQKLRMFLQDQISLAIDHGTSLSVLDCYELQMAAEDSGQQILPLHGLYKEWLPIELSAEPEKYQVNIDLAFSNPSPEDVIDQLTRDADFVISNFGHITHVTALTTGKVSNPEKYDFTNFSIQFVTNQKQIIRWSIQSVTVEETEITYKLQSPDGNEETILYRPEKFEIQTDVSGNSVKVITPLTAEKNEPKLDSEGQVILPDWNRAVKGMEVREAMLKSMRRGRTVELNFDQRSEQQTFKGLMAAWGCGLILLGLGIMFVLAIVRPSVAYGKYICIGFTVILCLFVAAQSLYLLTSEDK